MRLIPTLIAGAAVIAAPASIAAAGSQEAADAAIDAFTAAVEEAGFVSDGFPANEDADLFDVVQEEGDDPADYICTESIAGVVADDGSLVGETARATSDSFSYRPPGDTASTDPMMALDSESISAAVVVIDDDGIDEADELIDTFGSDELQSCLEDASEEMIAAQEGIEDASVTVEADDDLEVGDNSSSFTLASSFVSDGEESGFSSTFVLARTGNNVVLVTLFGAAAGDAVYDPVEALQIVVDELE